MFKKIHILRVYTGNIKSHEYMTYINEHKKSILIESLVLLILLMLLFFLSKSSLYMLVPVILAVYNLVFIYLRILRSNKYVLINSNGYRIKFIAIKFFFRLEELEETLKNKDLDKAEIEKWINYYVKKFKSSHSFVNFKQTTTQLEDYIKSLKNELTDDSEKIISNFERKKYNKYINKYFEELPSLITANKIDLKLTSNNTITKRLNYSESVERALRALGLSSNTKSLDIVTQRYYSLVQMYHPDRSKAPDATKKLTEINKAYRVLKNFFQ